MKDQLMLLVAVLAGLAATVLAFFYIDSATAGVEEVEAPRNLVKVLITVNDLPANQAIDAAGDLREEFFDADVSPGIAMGAIKASDRDAVNGRPVSSPVAAGVPLLYAHLTPIEDMNLGAGMRAMAIQVSSENMMGGLLVPGDRVDILVSYRRKEEVDPTAPNPLAGLGMEAMMAEVANDLMSQVGVMAGGSQTPDDWITEDVLTNVRIIAVGQALTGSRQALAYGMGGGMGGAQTITIEVAPHQAKQLIGAQGNGANPLTLLLRPEEHADPATGASFGG